LELYVSSGRIVLFQIASQLRCIASRECLQTSRNSLLGKEKPLKLYYLHAVYTIQTTGPAQGPLVRLSTLTFRYLDSADMDNFCVAKLECVNYFHVQ